LRPTFRFSALNLPEAGRVARTPSSHLEIPHHERHRHVPDCTIFAPVALKSHGENAPADLKKARESADLIEALHCCALLRPWHVRCYFNGDSAMTSYSSSRGFTLLETAIVMVVFGIVMAFSIPAYQSYTTSNRLKQAIGNINGQLRLAREKALATSTTQTMHFTANYQNADYHIHNDGVVDPKWKLPPGIQYYWGGGTQSVYRMTKNGRCLDSGMIILQDPKGNRDTVSVQISGLVLSK
jgi:prepilin-type N-terminal cleavage/methylation domain-containing protein